MVAVTEGLGKRCFHIYNIVNGKNPHLLRLGSKRSIVTECIMNNKNMIL